MPSFFEKVTGKKMAVREWNSAIHGYNLVCIHCGLERKNKRDGFWGLQTVCKACDQKIYEGQFRQWHFRTKVYGWNKRGGEWIEGTLDRELGTFTWEEWRQLVRKYANRCVRCCSRVPLQKMTIDHVIPTSKGGLNTIGNIQPLCKRCNSTKHDNCTDFRR